VDGFGNRYIHHFTRAEWCTRIKTSQIISPYISLNVYNTKTFQINVYDLTGSIRHIMYQMFAGCAVSKINLRLIARYVEVILN
jgi:hypothetical protein